MERFARSYAKGFTLLEILVAIAIFAMVGVASYSMLNNLQRSEEISREASKALKSLQLAWLTIERDISQIAARSVRVAGEAPSKEYVRAADGLLESDADGIAFTRLGWRNPQARLPRSTLQAVAYRLQQNRLERLHYIYPDSVVGQEPEITVLMEGVIDFSLRFYVNGSWSDNLQSGQLPGAIEVTLETESNGIISRRFLTPLSQSGQSENGGGDE